MQIADSINYLIIGTDSGKHLNEEMCSTGINDRNY